MAAEQTLVGILSDCTVGNSGYLAGELESKTAGQPPLCWCCIVRKRTSANPFLPQRFHLVRYRLAAANSAADYVVSGF